MKETYLIWIMDSMLSALDLFSSETAQLTLSQNVSDTFLHWLAMDLRGAEAMLSASNTSLVTFMLCDGVTDCSLTT